MEIDNCFGAAAVICYTGDLGNDWDIMRQVNRLRICSGGFLRSDLCQWNAFFQGGAGVPKWGLIHGRPGEMERLLAGNGRYQPVWNFTNQYQPFVCRHVGHNGVCGPRAGRGSDCKRIPIYQNGAGRQSGRPENQA
jgi:hypothetical protein